MKTKITAEDVKKAKEILHDWKTISKMKGKLKEIEKIEHIENVIKELTGS